MRRFARISFPLRFVAAVQIAFALAAPPGALWLYCIAVGLAGVP